ncbi:DUF58 domain-containing protein [Microbacterium barkeri]|uniref:DUF58 domain-containing protein n=1 Tax=Microbacterium barkeri TaxID=33917 RepID=UPI0024AF2FFD|nr:DUF58 domain-containing protein [Microbacterium barkeri]MDI6944789.1 DUF58 domain-containing protein [Microbacterium barkeri]
MRRHPLTVRGAGALALGAALFVAAHAVGSTEALAYAMLLFALVAACALSLYLRRSPERVIRTLRPETVAVGEESTVALRISGRSLLPTPGGTWADELPGGFAGDATGALPASLLPSRGASGALELTYAVTGVRRGAWTLGPLTVVEHDPFGIARRTRRLGGMTPVTVTPRIVPLSPLPRLAGDSGVALASAERRGQGSDNLIPRPYAPGDSMRRIHWRASARLGEFMVREEEQEASPQAVVVLDRGTSRWSPSAASPGGDSAFEAAVSLCVSAAWRLAADGYIVRVIDGDGAPLASLGQRGAAQGDERAELLRAFTTIGTRSADTLPRLDEVLAGVTTGPLVLIAGRLEPSDAAVLARTAHRGALPLLFASAPQRDALDEARRAGWRSVALEADVEDAWQRAVNPGARYGRR